MARIGTVTTIVSLVTLVAFPAGAAPDGNRLDSPGRTTSEPARTAPRVALGAAGPVVAFDDTRDFAAEARVSARTDTGWKDRRLGDGDDLVLASTATGTVWAVSRTGDVLAAWSSAGDGTWIPGATAQITGDDDTPARLVAARALGDRVLLAFGDPCGGETVTRVFDPVAGTLGDVEHALPDTGSEISIAVDRDGVAWMTGGRSWWWSSTDVTSLARREPATGQWTVTEFAGSSSAATVTALPNGEILFARSTGDSTRVQVREPIRGTWSDPLVLDGRASALALASDSGGGVLDRSRALLVAADGNAARAWRYEAGIVPLVAGTWSALGTFAYDVDSLAMDARPGSIGVVTGNWRNLRYRELGGDTWSDEEAPYGRATIAAWKRVRAVTATADGLRVAWSDDRGRRSGRETLRSAPLAGGSADEVTRRAVYDLASGADGSTLTVTGPYDRMTLTVHPSDVSSRMPRRTYPTIAAFGHGSYVVTTPLRRDGERRLWVRVFDEGVWHAPVVLDTRAAWNLSAFDAGAGIAWLTWTENLPIDGRRASRVMGARVTIDAVASPEILTQQPYQIGSLASGGDGDGEPVIAWTPRRDDRAFAMRRGGTPARLPLRLGFGMTVLGTPDGDITVLSRSWRALHGVRRLEGGAFERIPRIRIDDAYDGPVAITPIDCCCVVDYQPDIFVLPGGADATIDGIGTVRVWYRRDGRLRSAALARASDAWAMSNVTGEAWSYDAATELGGDTGIAWTTPMGADQQVRATELRAPQMASTIRIDGSAARLLTPAGMPIPGMSVILHTADATTIARTDVAGYARADGPIVSAVFAGTDDFAPAAA